MNFEDKNQNKKFDLDKFCHYALIFIIVFAIIFFSTVGFIGIKRNNAEDNRILSMSSKSEAHEFLAKTYLSCQNGMSTRNPCLIKASAMARIKGEDFELSVNNAIQEMGLLDPLPSIWSLFSLNLIGIYNPRGNQP